MAKKDNYHICLILLVAGILLFAAGCISDGENGDVIGENPETNENSSVVITQSDGSLLTLPNEAERIIVVNANAAELLVVIGAQDLIVGGTGTVLRDDALAPFISDNVTVIGDWQTPNIETILSLNPDVIIAYDSYKPKDLEKITSANISILYLDCYRINSIVSDARSLGNLTGKQEKAEEFATFIEQNLDMVSERLSGIQQDEWPSVYFESYVDYTTSGTGSAAQELLEFTHGDNIIGETQLSSVVVTPEWIILENPDVVLKAASFTLTKYEDYPEAREDIISRSGMETVSAVKSDRVYIINGDYLYGPRSFSGVMYLAKIFYPELFEDIDPADYLQEFSGRFMPGLKYNDAIYPANIT